MKKLLIGGCILIIISSCNNSGKNNKGITQDTNKAKLAKLAAPRAHVPGWALNGYTADDALKMIDTFKKYYSGDTNRAKSISVWYNVAQLKVIFNLIDSENPSGVRFYLGALNSANGSNTKIISRILMVPTKDDSTITGNGTSIHKDYYVHSGSILPSAGEEIDDDNGGIVQVGNRGGRFYGSSAPIGNCVNPGTHFLSNDEANKWIKNRNDDGTSKICKTPFTTISEWFEYKCFLRPLLSTIIDSAVIIDGVKSKFSGLRIYVGYGFLYTSPIDHKKSMRDVFILFPTVTNKYGKEVEYADCLENLVRPGTFCNNPALAEARKRHRRALGVGYDDGELCPDNCNVDTLGLVAPKKGAQKVKK